MAFKNGSSVHAAVLAVQHKACGQQEHAAENDVIAVQLKVSVAVALDLDGCGVRTPLGVWLNVHILQGHIGSVAVFGGNGDGVGSGLGFAGGLVFGGQDELGSSR